MQKKWVEENPDGKEIPIPELCNYYTQHLHAPAVRGKRCGKKSAASVFWGQLATGV